MLWLAAMLAGNEISNASRNQDDPANFSDCDRQTLYAGIRLATQCMLSLNTCVRTIHRYSAALCCH